MFRTKKKRTFYQVENPYIKCNYAEKDLKGLLNQYMFRGEFYVYGMPVDPIAIGPITNPWTQEKANHIVMLQEIASRRGYQPTCSTDLHPGDTIWFGVHGMRMALQYSHMYTKYQGDDIRPGITCLFNPATGSALFRETWYPTPDNVLMFYV